MKLLLLTNNQILLTQIDEIGGDIGEPDCKLIKPFQVKLDKSSELPYLEPWLLSFTKQDTFMISSEKILTITDPTPTLLEKYIDLTA